MKASVVNKIQGLKVLDTKSCEKRKFLCLSRLTVERYLLFEFLVCLRRVTSDATMEVSSYEY